MGSLKCYSIFSFIALFSLVHIQLSFGAVKGGYFIIQDNLTASNIDSTLFTDLFCAFAGIDSQTNQLTVPSECQSFAQAVKIKNPAVKVHLAIGGGMAKPTSDLKAMASNPSSRKTFIESSINTATQYKFDGLNLDWEQQSTAAEMANLGALVTEWRAASQANPSSKRLLLTAALHYSATANGFAFPAKNISASLDWVNVMAYDFYGPGGNPKNPFLTRPNAALHGQNLLNGESGINSWTAAGVPANKLVLGLPFYGYAWKLVNPNDNGILAPVSGVDTTVGDHAGAATYKQIVKFINEKKATHKYNSTYVTNYCYSGNTWIGFDGLMTITQKVTYAKSAPLLGYFAWNINQDDNWALSKQASKTWGPA